MKKTKKPQLPLYLSMAAWLSNLGYAFSTYVLLWCKWLGWR